MTFGECGGFRSPEICPAPRAAAFSPCGVCPQRGKPQQQPAKGHMRRFTLRRHKDVSGISGTGDVADGVEFKDGVCVVHWYGDDPSTVVWPTFGSVQRIHGHNGNTEIVWHDNP